MRFSTALRNASVVLALGASFGAAETCSTAQEMNPNTRQSLRDTATRYADAVISGNGSTLQQNAIPTVAQNFASITQTMSDLQPKVAGAQAKVRNVYQLEADGTQTLERAEFFCGVFNTPQRVSFVIPNLPPGHYGLAITETSGGQQPYYISFVLQQDAPGSPWKVAGFIPSPMKVAGKDALDYWREARDFKNRGEGLMAYVYYRTAADIIAPVGFMDTPGLEGFDQERRSVSSPDVPTGQTPASIATSDGKTYSITDVFAVPTPADVKNNQKGLTLVVKFQTDSVADNGKAFQDNMAVIKALADKHPDLRNNFDAVVARATEPDGKDFGSLLAVTDIK
jgi:hypothetical protein